MKNYAKIVLALMLVVALFGLVACDSVSNEQHTHTFAKEWTMSETEHWHVATCEHITEVSDRAPHQFETKVTKKVTANEDGELLKTCSVCGYSKTEILSHTSHEHIIGWTSDRVEHTQTYICCEEKLTNPTHGEHDYTDGAICKICNAYNVVEDAREKLNNGVFSYSLVVENITLLLSNIDEDNNDLVVKSGAFKVGLDENCMLTLVGKYSGVKSKKIEVSGEKTETAETNVSGTIVIDNNKVYLTENSDGQNLIVDKVYDNHEDFGGSQTYYVYDLNKLFEFVGVDDFNGVFNKVLDGIYAYSDEIKTVVDKITSIDTGDNFDTWFVKTEDGSYKLNFGVINDFNDKAKDTTVGKLLSDLLGNENYKEGAENLVKAVLGFKVGDLLDLLEQQGVDIYQINDKINEFVAKFNPGEEKTIEEILIANGVLIPANAQLADLIDNKLTRAYSVLDIINMIGKDISTEEKPFTALTTDDIVAMVNELLDEYGPKTIYQVVAEVVTWALSKTESPLTITASNIYTIIDELGSFLQDCLHINVVLNNGKVVSVSLKIAYEQPAEEQPSEDTDSAQEGETDQSDEDEDPMGLNQMIPSLMMSVRSVLAENCSIQIKFNDSSVGVDVDAAIAEINKGIDDVIPEGTDSVAKILEAYGYENIVVTQKDGRDYITAEYTSIQSYNNIHQDGNYDDDFHARYTATVGGFADEIVRGVELFDKCTDNKFAAMIGFTFDTVEVSDIYYYWYKSGQISEEKLAQLRETYNDRQDDYPTLFGKPSERDFNKEMDCIYDATTKTYTDISFDAMNNLLQHDYELVSGNLEDINSDYYTKLVYKCQTCDHMVTVFVMAQPQSETETDIAA